MARERLIRWEVDERQIKKIVEDGKPVTTSLSGAASGSCAQD
jgi:hypothetical protein